MPKQKSRQQELEDISEAKLVLLLTGWVVNKLGKDFGIDFDIRVTEPNLSNPRNKDVTGWHFSLQLKSTDDGCEKGFFEDLSLLDWNLFLENSTPVVLAKYYSKCDSMMYEIIQPYAWNILDREEPNWKTATQKRIRLSKKIDNLDELKKDVHEAFTQIVQKWHYYYAGIGEGINPSDFNELRDRDLQGFKQKTLITAFYKIRAGDEEEGIKLLEEVYSCPKEDVLKFIASINLVSQLNPFNFQNHDKIIEYAEEGIKLSDKIGDKAFKDYLIITVHNICLVQVIYKISQILYAKRISNLSDGDFVPIYDMEIVQLYQIQDGINKDIQASIASQFNSDNLYGLALSLSTMMETVIYQVERFSIVNNNLPEIEASHRRPFVESYEKLLSIINDEAIIQFGHYLLAKYFFYLCDYQKSEGHITKAIEVAETNGDEVNCKLYNHLMIDIKGNKSPFDSRNQMKMGAEEITFAQHREALIKSLELQGISTSDSEYSDEFKISDAIKLGLDDADPSEYLRYCDNIRIEYIGTSMLGKNIGLFSLGQKVMWCAQSGALEGVSLKTLYHGFTEGYCKNCTMRRERPIDWVCTIKLFEEINTDPLFQIYLKNRSKYS